MLVATSGGGGRGEGLARRGDTRISRDRSPRVVPWKVLRDLRYQPQCAKVRSGRRSTAEESSRHAESRASAGEFSPLFSTPLVSSLVVTPPRARSLAGSSDDDDDEDDDGGGGDERARSRRP